MNFKYLINLKLCIKIKSDSRSAITKISKKDSLSYQLNFSGFRAEEVDVNIKNNNLIFKASNRKELDNNHSDSSFLYSFFVSDNFDLENPKIIREKGNIIVKFNKKPN